VQGHLYQLLGAANKEAQLSPALTLWTTPFAACPHALALLAQHAPSQVDEMAQTAPSKAPYVYHAMQDTQGSLSAKEQT
jgi:hypothetical protein